MSNCNTFAIERMVRALVTLGGHIKSRVALVRASKNSSWTNFRRNKVIMTSHKNDALDGLEPETLWQMFATLSSIPRPSFHEGKVIEWLKDFAEERKLSWEQDEAGNMVIRHPGTMEGRQAAPVIIQGHVDMVTEKNDSVEHDFFRDPIKLIREGDWLKADGTTLGADNGLGVACALAVLDTRVESKDVLLPPIEALFTVAEETGLVGAFNLDGTMLTGKTLLNLDTEDWPDIFIGCAGGGDSLLTVTLHAEEATGAAAYDIKISGLSGGHSGMDIDKYRGNAVKIAADLAERLLAKSISIAAIEGGDKRNAIARESTIRIICSTSDASALQDELSLWQSEYRQEFGKQEPDLKFAMEKCDVATRQAIAPADAARIVALLLGLPHGVIKTSSEMEGLVETSNNVASIKMVMDNEQIVATIQCSTRSSIGSALERVRRSIRCIGQGFGAIVEQKEAYPGWQPQPDAPVVSMCRKAIEESSGLRPELKAIHAGLECGILGQRIPGVECVSFGPTIRGAHSPDERLQISTVKPFWDSTLLLLAKLAKM